VIAGHAGIRSVGDGSGSGLQSVPDRRSTTVFEKGPFDLVGGSGYSPLEAVGESKYLGQLYLLSFEGLARTPFGWALVLSSDRCAVNST